MNKYTFMTDVACDLNASQYEEYGIVCVPIGFTFGDKEYEHYADEREMDNSTFYARLEAGETVKTAQVKLSIYREMFENELKKGQDVIYLSLSSGLSGTYSTACLVAEDLREEYPERRIEVVDTKCASIGQGLLVITVGQAYRDGIDMDGLLARIRETAVRCCHWFSVDNLMYLKRGGRLSTVEAFVGSVLSVNPILSMDEEGKLKVVSKERGTRNAIAYLLRRLREDADKPEEQTILIAHADAPQKAELLKKLIEDNGLAKEVVVCKIGPVIGAHVGNGMCALTFLGNNYRF